MTSWECYENKWFYMKYIGKYLSGEILLTSECLYKSDYKIIIPQSNKREFFLALGRMCTKLKDFWFQAHLSISVCYSFGKMKQSSNS